MARTKKFKVKKVAEALEDSMGMVSHAAVKLDCSISTVIRYIKQHESLQVVQTEATEKTLDLCESKLIGRIMAGDLSALIFFLKCKGKDRGYVERQEFEDVGKKKKFVIKLPKDWNTHGVSQESSPDGSG